MLRDAFFILRQDVRHSLRLPQVWAWMLVMPLLLAYIIGSLMQVLAPRPERIAVYTPPAAGFLADDMVRRLGAVNYEVVRIGEAARLTQYPLRMAIPGGFTESVLSGPPAQIELAYPAGSPLIDYERFRVDRAVYEMLADLTLLSKQGRQPEAVTLAALAREPRKLELKAESAGESKKLVLGFQQSVPGFLVMFTLLVSLTSGSMLLIIERRTGVLRRLASTPVSRGSIVTGKLGARLALGLIQVGIAMLAGTWWFGVDWGGSRIWAVLALLAAYAALCASLSLLFASLARNEDQSLAAGVIASNLLAALGGCWWPVEITPAWMQHAAMLLPTGWAMDGLHRLLSYGASPVRVAPHVAALLACSLLAGWIAARRFRFE
jgi:ABC-type multidrug transport system permease subunit